MIINIYLFFLINVFLFAITDAIPRYRYRRQLISNQNDDLPYGGWAGGTSNPSGANPGAYYGTGVNPHYGGFRPNQNTAYSDSISVINYNQDYFNNGGYHSNWNLQQQQPNTNYYYNQPYNRYPPGSQGWYATGGNHWHNKGQSLIPCAWLLTIGILISTIYI